LAKRLQDSLDSAALTLKKLKSEKELLPKKKPKNDKVND
jgi:hypothetical protein